MGRVITVAGYVFSVGACIYGWVYQKDTARLVVDTIEALEDSNVFLLTVLDELDERPQSSGGDEVVVLEEHEEPHGGRREDKVAVRCFRSLNHSTCCLGMSLKRLGRLCGSL